MSDTKSKVLGVLLILSFALLPIYLFPSGSAQVVDVTMLALGATVIFGLTHGEIRMLGLAIAGLLVYAFYALIVNTGYFFIYGDPGFVLASVQILYPVFVLFVFAISFKRLLNTEDGIKYAYIAALIAALLPWTVKGAYEGIAARNALSFNNPNQLGYFSVLLYIFWSLIWYYHKSFFPHVLERRWWPIAISLYIIVSVHVFALITASRASIGAVMIINSFHLIRLLQRRFIPAAVIVLGLSITSIFISMNYKTVITETTAAKRIERVNYLAELHKRLLNRLELEYGKHGMNVIFGTGGAGFERFSSSQEVHNMFGAAFRSYGLIGLILLIVAGIIYTRAVYRIPGALWFLTAIIVYNMSHNGLRFRPFWVVLAFLLAVSYAASERTMKVEPQRRWT